jgi:hypothetical protein
MLGTIYVIPEIDFITTIQYEGGRQSGITAQGTSTGCKKGSGKIWVKLLASSLWWLWHCLESTVKQHGVNNMRNWISLMK